MDEQRATIGFADSRRVFEPGFDFERTARTSVSTIYRIDLQYESHDMLKITSSAWDRLNQISSDRPDVAAIRLKFAKGEFKCCAGNRREQDRIIEDEGRPTLLMSPAVARHLDRRILDAAETKRGLRLRLRPRKKRGIVAKGN